MRISVLASCLEDSHWLILLKNGKNIFCPSKSNNNHIITRLVDLNALTGFKFPCVIPAIILNECQAKRSSVWENYVAAFLRNIEVFIV